SKPFTGLAAGNFTINETAVAGYTQAVVCDSGESGTGSVTVSLQPGEAVTCTFTNTAQPGQITIVKQVVGQVPPTNWFYSGDLDEFNIAAAGGSRLFEGLTADDYTVTETGKAGYTQAVSCDSGETGAGSVTVSLQPGEVVLCTFTNTAQPGTITLIKETDPDGGAGFPFTVIGIPRVWGSLGGGDGQFRGASGVAVD